MIDLERVFAIGDVHGCSHTFRKLLLEEIRVRKTDEIYCVGDYIDRGPDSKGVVDFILELREKGYQIHTLRGNHEQIMMDSVNGEMQYDLWIVNGGAETLKSFGVDSYADIKPRYRNFFSETSHFIATGNYIFVHAGLNFENDDIFEDKNAMLWIRYFTVDQEKLGDRIIIHGHTPIPADSIPYQHSEHVINIDGGCVYSYRPGYGHLFAIDVHKKEFISVKNLDC